MGLEDEWISEIAVTPWGLFVGTLDAGIFRLEANGAWTPLGLEVWRGRMIPQALAYVPAEPPRLLVGLKFRQDSNDTTRAAVYASFDRGESWIPFDGGLGAESRFPYRVFVDDLEVDPGNPHRVFMSNCHGVLRSIDAGHTWNFVLGGFNLCSWNVDLLIDPDRTGRIWVAGQGNIFNPRVSLTPDWGQSWDGDIPTCRGVLLETLVNALALASGAGDRIFAAADAALYRSDNGGEPGSWDCVPGVRGAVIDIEELGDALYATTALWQRGGEADGDIPSHLGVYRTSDRGEVWEPLVVPDDALGATEAASDTERNRLLIGTRAGLWMLVP